MPEISIIVPVYQAEHFLDRCVGSILSQSYQDYELILVNDGSRDRSGEICDAYGERYDNIHVFHKENGGQATARNLALDWVMENSDSKWIAFIDSDDWVHRDYLKLLLESARKWNAGVVTCDFLCTAALCEDQPVTAENAILVDSDTAIRDYYAMCMSPCCKLYDRRLFATLRFAEGKRYEDAFITHIPVLEAGHVAILCEKLYYYYENPNSSTRKKWDVRNLDQIEAHEARVRYCREHGFSRAYCAELEWLVITYYSQMVALQQAVKEDRSLRKYIRDLRPKLIPALRLARSNGLIPFNKRFLWIYEIAYPVKPIWVLRNLLEKTVGFDYPK